MDFDWSAHFCKIPSFGEDDCFFFLRISGPARPGTGFSGDLA